MGKDFQHQNLSNLAFIKHLRDSGAKTVFKMTIPNHRLPSLNQMNAVQKWQRKKIKDQEKAAFDTALSSTATGHTSLTLPTQA